MLFDKCLRGNTVVVSLPLCRVLVVGLRIWN